MKKLISLAIILLALMSFYAPSYAKKSPNDKTDSHGLVQLDDGYYDVGGHMYEGYNSSGSSFTIAFKKSGLAYIRSTKNEFMPDSHKGSIAKWTYEGNGMVSLDIENQMPIYLTLTKDGKKITFHESYQPMTLKLIK